MQTQIKHQAAILNTIKELYFSKGWNAVYGYLKAAKINHRVYPEEFGLDNIKNRKARAEFIENCPHDCFRANFSHRRVTSRKTKFSYNVIRAQEIKLMP